MRIILNELKKIFRPAYVVTAAVLAAIFLFLYTKEGSAIVAAYSNNAYMNEVAFSPETDEFNTYKWFVNTFGAKVTDETIEKMDKMTYPELDELLGTLDEFADFGIHDTDELSEFINKTFVDEYFCDDYLFINCSYEKFEKTGITIEDWEDNTQNIGNRLFGLSSVMNKGIEGVEDPDKQERIREQWLEYLACTRAKKLYYETRKDPLYGFRDYSYWSVDMNYTLSAYRREWYNRNDAYHHTKPSSYWENITPEEREQVIELTEPTEYAERIAKRAVDLGDEFFYVREFRIFWGWQGCGYGIIILSALLCIVFAAPYAIADKRNITPLQYTTKCGRKIERKKLCAVVLLAVIMSALSAAAILLIMPHDVCAQWFDLPLTSFSSHDLLWLDANMWQYIALYIGISFLVNIGTAVTAYTVCGFCGNIITAVTVSVPLIIGELLLWAYPLSHIFSLPESPAETPLLVSIILLFGAAGAVVCGRKAKRAMI